jgi:hypothetical protein
LRSARGIVQDFRRKFAPEFGLVPPEFLVIPQKMLQKLTQ